MDILNIPGYAEALLKERVVRDAAFLGINESIGPFEVVPMTLRHWIILRLAHNPLLCTGSPGPIDLFNFLWLLSPHYSPKGGIAKRRLLRKCRRLFFPPLYLALLNTARARARYIRRHTRKLIVATELITEARAFVAETMQDKPAAQSNGWEPDYYSDAAFFCALFGREFGWTEGATLNMPLKRLFQYLSEHKDRHGSRTPLSNPSDRIRAIWLREQSRKDPPHVS